MQSECYEISERTENGDNSNATARPEEHTAHEAACTQTKSLLAMQGTKESHIGNDNNLSNRTPSLLGGNSIISVARLDAAQPQSDNERHNAFETGILPLLGMDKFSDNSYGNQPGLSEPMLAADQDMITLFGIYRDRVHPFQFIVDDLGHIEKLICSLGRNFLIYLVRHEHRGQVNTSLIQALLILGFVLQNDMNPRAAWILGGTTVRLALSIGLHQPSNQSALCLSPLETQNLRHDSEAQVQESREILAELIQTLTERSKDIGHFSTAHKKALRAIQVLQRLSEEESRCQSEEQPQEQPVVGLLENMTVSQEHASNSWEPSMTSLDDWLRDFDFDAFSPLESYNFIMSDQVPQDFAL
ncbi:hypothetical protein FBEOM_1454 [Fusarium beomiforme]|uniref:Xylanolytic transcriptional activator regulatory domain-containing protein n=1 Tax=Fusarium beomiforme TaxID=44412 RepID=A0A9P5AT83_9HYPO|nr:hypothetical protein FBEOM_1454 [Fusarium beomiforme]